jgi:cell division protease FtsH
MAMFTHVSSSASRGKKSRTRKASKRPAEVLLVDLLRKHFAPIGFDAVSVSERKFPFRVRADLQRSIDRLFADRTVTLFCGVRKEYSHEGIDFSGLMTLGSTPAVFVPPQYEDVDIGEEHPVRCLKIGLWLLAQGTTKYAVLLTPAMKWGQPIGVSFQIAIPNTPQGAALADDFFRRLEEAVRNAESYRGKILSLEIDANYRGHSTGIKVHKLRTVARDQVILPRKTLDLLDRNVIGFVRNRPKLAKFKQSTKKGILFYGPPGTGKTHTLHYLAAALPGHTTLLISAEQVGHLDEYMALARLLQPSMVLIEDVDLIARDRSEMNSPCEEVLLNKLLNEMDGLREDADILFILTTNRHEDLEAALASRPGRVDQAIEFPLPDDEGRGKLVALYSTGLRMSQEVVEQIGRRTDGVSAAFIKELMRRCAQFHLEHAETGTIELSDVEQALDEMLFAGGSLNRKLLGAGGPEQSPVE